MKTNEIRHAVAAAVRARLAWLDMSQKELALAIGHNQPWVSVRVNGHVPFTIEDLDEVCGAMDITVIDLLGRVYDDTESSALDRRRQVKRSSTCSPPIAIVPDPRPLLAAA